MQYINIQRIDEMSLTHYPFISEKIPAIIFILLIIITFPVLGDENREKESWAKLSLGLELLLDEKTEEVVIVLEKVISIHPVL